MSPEVTRMFGHLLKLKPTASSWREIFDVEMAPTQFNYDWVDEWQDILDGVFTSMSGDIEMILDLAYTPSGKVYGFHCFDEDLLMDGVSSFKDFADTAFPVVQTNTGTKVNRGKAEGWVLEAALAQGMGEESKVFCSHFKFSIDMLGDRLQQELNKVDINQFRPKRKSTLSSMDEDTFKNPSLKVTLGNYRLEGKVCDSKILLTLHDGPHNEVSYALYKDSEGDYEDVGMDDLGEDFMPQGMPEGSPELDQKDSQGVTQREIQNEILKMWKTLLLKAGFHDLLPKRRGIKKSMDEGILHRIDRELNQV